MMMLLLITACSGTRHLPEGEKLYTGGVIKLESKDDLKNSKIRFIKKTAENGLSPKPNKSYLGMRPKLWIYMLAGDHPKSKFKKWLKKTGEAPVLMSQVNSSMTSDIINAKLYNIGIFKGITQFNIIEKKRTMKVIYTSTIHKPYTTKVLINSISDDSVRQLILSRNDETLIKPGEDYNLEKLKTERNRMDALLKNHGYFYFNPDYLNFKADTSEINRTVSFNLELKDSIPQNATIAYRINQVIIDQDYSLAASDSVQTKDTIHYQGTIFLGKEAEMEIRPRVILRSVFLKKQELYSRKNHSMTLNRLMSMGNFKFVRVKFSESDTVLNRLLDVLIFMTPMSKHTFKAEVDIISKSNNYTGPKLNLSFLNRNTFKGAELLNLKIDGRFEAQLSGKNKNLFSYSISPKVEMYFPRFLLPFKILESSMYTPKTRLSLSFTFLKMVNYYDMRTFEIIYGFKWKEEIRKEHELNPISVSYSSFGNQSAEFVALLASNPFLKKSYEEQFIAGGSYSFRYNEQVLPGKKMQYYFHLATEFAGNSLSLVKIIGGNKISSDEPLKVVGSVFSQFARISVDGRGYYNLQDQNKLVSRIFMGLAVPYGNSITLPYSKQFFSGGPNSIRAFHINSVGPGNYNQSTDSGIFLQLGGDVKLELNGEYRFNIISFFKGALFVDAGNVWELKSNPANTGSSFSFSNFISEVAVGAGVGLRIDVSFFVLRFDLAIPLRKPWLEENSRWVVNEISPGSSTWRRENLVLNIAIGYPF